MLKGATYRWTLGLMACGTWILFSPQSLVAQFSPGPLSRAHERLEGSTRCTQCHEVGREISGRKCLACHEEIRSSIDARQGYHFSVSSRECVACHKEHLGKDAKTMSFDERTFDHSSTGFTLSGKHSSLRCEACHSGKFVAEPAVVKMLSSAPHRTYLGLRPNCAGCHPDPHHGQFSAECASCHSSDAWSPARNFDHSKTKFPLEASHRSVACEKCHEGMARKTGGGLVNLGTKPFADCTPCHSSPHVSRFEGAACRTCHAAEGWASAMAKPFDHSATRYRLEGKHARLRCEQCHHVTQHQSFAQTFIMPYKHCTDCHADRHDGEFAKTFKNDCASCHTQQAYIPSTFTVDRHARARFVLAGAHEAVPCNSCHQRPESGPVTFHVADFRCEVCHRDVHRGEFALQMKEKSCAACHSTERWATAAFDHSKTKFPLEGKHAALACTECHKDQSAGSTARVEFKAISTACQSCHPDAHAGQFAAGVSTDCSSCHGVEAWKSVLFDHNTRTSFPLTGGHARVACADCHHRELIGDTTVVRYRPVSAACESCHQRRTGQ